MEEKSKLLFCNWPLIPHNPQDTSDNQACQYTRKLTHPIYHVNFNFNNFPNIQEKIILGTKNNSFLVNDTVCIIFMHNSLLHF